MRGWRSRGARPVASRSGRDDGIDEDPDARHRRDSSQILGRFRVAALARIAERGSRTLVSGVFAHRLAKGNVFASYVNDALARALALGLPRLRVNAVLPGLVDTPLRGNMPADRRTALFTARAERQPNRYLGSPDNIAALTLSRMAKPILAGSVLVAEGGHVLIRSDRAIDARGQGPLQAINCSSRFP